MTYACVYWALVADVSPVRIFQSVATGFLGSASFEGGWITAALGLATHFGIAMTMSATYYLVSGRWESLWRRPAVFGAAYGLVLYGVMNFVVVPLSRAGGSGPRNDLWTWLSVLIHVLVIGLPIAFATRRARRAAGMNEGSEDA